MLKKRVLWILNHDTLGKFELPLMRDLGFEIFTPKSVTKEILQASGSVTYEYDTTLTIPEEDLKILNQYNFYENEEMPFYIRKIINSYFDIAIVMFDFYAIKNLVYYFEGNIFARAFGLGQNHSYVSITEENLFLKMEQIKNRFWFSHCYQNIKDIESGVYKEKAVFMPLGLPEEFYEIENQWNGKQNKLLFFCSRIKIFNDAERIYNEFKKNFSGFDFLIAGNQPVPVDDNRVTGFLEREELNALYRECKVMFYHSTYPRHLHYHPLEAMIAGMPVIYLDGGLLSILGGKRQTGCAKTIKEAQSKVKRILDGDEQFIEWIREDQKEILYKFSYEYNRLEWEENFLPIIASAEPAAKSPITLAVFITDHEPQHHKDDYSKQVELLSKGLKKLNPLNNVTLNILSEKFDIESDFLELKEPKVGIRQYNLESFSLEAVKDSLHLTFRQEPLWFDQYAVPVDHARNYINTDYWLFLNDNIEQPIIPIKSYGIYIEHLGSRFYETYTSTKIYNLKMATFILTNSVHTKNELINHLGINGDKILLLPPINAEPKDHLPLLIMSHLSDHILIELDLDQPESIMRLLNDISDYFRLFNSDQKIKLHLNNNGKNGVNIINDINLYINDNELLNEKVIVYSNLGSNEYNALYATAKKIIFPHHLKNMFFKLSKAHFFSKLIIINEYPVYKEYEKDLGCSFRFMKFQSKSNVILEILSEDLTARIEEEKIICEQIKDSSSEWYIQKISEMWRKML